MADEIGLEAPKEAVRIEKPKPPSEPPKEAAPLGASEKKIIDRIDQDGDEDKVLQDIARSGTEDLSQVSHPSKENFRQEVSAEDSRRIDTRIQKSKRIAHDLKPADGKPFSRERVDEVRDIEMRSEQGDEAGKNGLEELVFDTRGYKPTRFQVDYVDSQGKTITEDLIRFAKQGDNGQEVYLKFPDGRAVAGNASLYESRLTSRRHAQGVDYATKMMPRVDGRGAYTGIVTLIEDKNPASTLDSSPEPETPKKESKFDGAIIRRELEKPKRPGELPAVDILVGQLDKNQADILKKAPGATRQQVALSLSQRFLNQSLYQRISEQALFGPKDFERFDDPNKLAPLLPAMKKDLADAEQTILTERPTAKIIRENGWLYVDQGKQKTDYRIYLSPDPTKVGKVFSDLALTIPESAKYQMKTFDDPTHAVEMSRTDKIIVYCPESDFDVILGAVGSVYQQNQESFQGRLTPGGGTISPAEGISITKQPEKSATGKEVTGTQQVADTIEQVLNQRLTQITKGRLGKFQDVRTANGSDEAKLLSSVMQLDHDGVSKFWYAGKESLNDSQRTALTSAYLQALYSSVLHNSVEGKPISTSEVRQNFLKSIQGRVQLRPNQLQHLTAEKMIQFQDQSIQDRTERVILQTGLAIAFNESLAKGEAPGDTFRNLLKT